MGKHKTLTDEQRFQNYLINYKKNNLKRDLVRRTAKFRELYKWLEENGQKPDDIIKEVREELDSK